MSGMPPHRCLAQSVEGFRPVARVQFLVGVVQMAFDRVQRNSQFLRDFLVRAAFAHQLHRFLFARGKQSFIGRGACGGLEIFQQQPPGFRRQWAFSRPCVPEGLRELIGLEWFVQ